MKNLTPVSWSRVTKALTEGEIKIMRETRGDPQDENRFVAMRGLLEALPFSARKCSARECVAMEFRGSRDFKDYTNFIIARCFNHSFHLACATDHDCV